MIYKTLNFKTRLKRPTKVLAFFLVALSLASCQKNSRPNYQYMPNMYTSVGYETYGEYDIFAGGQEAMAPADNTIARGHSLYGYENTNEGYDLAKANLTNPYSETVDLARGKAVYDIYCAICHGTQGKGDGYLMTNEKILGVPSYDARVITEGSVYHVIYFGKNTMGSYANQMNEEERWQVSAYVISLRDALTQN